MDELEKRVSELELVQREQTAVMKMMSEQIQELKSIGENLNKFAIVLERNTGELKRVSDNMGRLQCNMDEIQKAPAKRWDLVFAAIIAGVVGFVIKAVLS